MPPPEKIGESVRSLNSMRSYFRLVPLWGPPIGVLDHRITDVFPAFHSFTHVFSQIHNHTFIDQFLPNHSSHIFSQIPNHISQIFPGICNHIFTYIFLHFPITFHISLSEFKNHIQLNTKLNHNLCKIEDPRWGVL